MILCLQHCTCIGNCHYAFLTSQTHRFSTCVCCALKKANFLFLSPLFLWQMPAWLIQLSNSHESKSLWTLHFFPRVTLKMSLLDNNWNWARVEFGIRFPFFNFPAIYNNLYLEFAFFNQMWFCFKKIKSYRSSSTKASILCRISSKIVIPFPT